MSTGSVVWIVLYGIATLMFFAVAAGITVFGIQDLRSLLSRSEKKNREGKNDK